MAYPRIGAEPMTPAERKARSRQRRALRIQSLETENAELAAKLESYRSAFRERCDACNEAWKAEAESKARATDLETQLNAARQEIATIRFLLEPSSPLSSDSIG